MRKKAIWLIANGAEEIRSMKVRGATKIALHAAKVLTMAMKVEGQEANGIDAKEAAITLLRSRPTAISLSNALKFMLEKTEGESGRELVNILEDSYKTLERYSLLAQRGINDAGIDVVKKVILTHCNSQTALGIIKEGWEKGIVKKVFSLEARPRFQGRITVRQLCNWGIPATMIVDSACNYYMKDIDVNIVGADTVFPDGDLVNKIGTSQVALSANYHGVPFFSATSSLKIAPPTFPKKELIIEMRDEREVVNPEDFKGATILNPAFDLTKSRFIEGYITEWGILKPKDVKNFPFTSEIIKKFLKENSWAME